MTSKLNRISPQLLAGNPRATMAAWLKYEPIVKAAFKQHPRPYIYTPSNRTPATVASQLRDAIRGAIAFEHKSEIPHSDLLRWWSEVVVRNDKNTVYIGVPEKVVEAIAGHGTVDSQDSSMKFDILSLEEVAAFYCLLSTGRLQGPVIIANPPDLTLLPERPNVTRLDRPDGSVVLL